MTSLTLGHDKESKKLMDCNTPLLDVISKMKFLGNEIFLSRIFNKKEIIPFFLYIYLEYGESVVIVS